jgi:predicted transcriptional regulator
MTSIDLKTKLIEIINEIEDIEFLEAIKTILDSKTAGHYALTDKQKENIEVGRQQIQNGNFLKNDEVFSELKEWIKKK